MKQNSELKSLKHKIEIYLTQIPWIPIVIILCILEWFNYEKKK